MRLIAHDHREITGGMASSGHQHDIPRLSQTRAPPEWAKRRLFEGDRLRSEPLRPAVGKVAAHLPRPSLGHSVLLRGDQYRSVREVMQSSGVIGVAMGQHDRANIRWIAPQAPQLRADLFLWAHPLAHPEAEIGVPGRELARLGSTRRLPGIHHDQPFWMLDEPGVDGEWL